MPDSPTEKLVSHAPADTMATSLIELTMPESPDNTAARFLILDDVALTQQCEVDNYRSHGPGGQKRNKTSSAVRLRHNPTGLSVIAVEDRSQHVNKRRAIRRLRLSISLHVRCQIDVERYRMSDLLTQCVSDRQGIHVGRRDHRYPLAVAEILDLLLSCQMRVSDAAKLLGITTGKLSKFIAKDAKLFERVNQMRAQHGQKPLKRVK